MKALRFKKPCRSEKTQLLPAGGLPVWNPSEASGIYRLTIEGCLYSWAPWLSVTHGHLHLVILLRQCWILGFTRDVHATRLVGDWFQMGSKRGEVQTGVGPDQKKSRLGWNEGWNIMWTLVQVLNLISPLYISRKYWNIIDLQCCVSFRCTAKWFSYMYTYKYMYSFLTFSSIIGYYKILNGGEEKG